MAVAEIIGAAIGVMMLVLVAYILVGSVLTTTDVVLNAQKDLTLLQGARLGTDIKITSNSTTGSWLNFNVTNTGNEVIADFKHMDVFILDQSISNIQHITYEASGNTQDKWRKMGIYSGPTLNDPEFIHPNQLDPGERMWVCATYTGNPIKWFQITTGNGVNAQTTI